MIFYPFFDEKICFNEELDFSLQINFPTPIPPTELGKVKKRLTFLILEGGIKYELPISELKEIWPIAIIQKKPILFKQENLKLFEENPKNLFFEFLKTTPDWEF